MQALPDVREPIRATRPTAREPLGGNGARVPERPAGGAPSPSRSGRPGASCLHNGHQQLLSLANTFDLPRHPVRPGTVDIWRAHTAGTLTEPVRFVHSGHFIVKDCILCFNRLVSAPCQREPPTAAAQRGSANLLDTCQIESPPHAERR